MADVAIIGGGIAGLAAARTLRNAGVKPTIFEASDIVGGSARSLTIDDITIDEGFHLINTWYPAVKEILTSGEYDTLGVRAFPAAIQTLTPHGLSLIGDPVRAPRIVPALLRSRLQRAISFRDLSGLRRWLGTEMNHRSSFELRPTKTRPHREDRSVAEALDKYGVKGRTRELIVDPLLEGFLHDPHGDTSAAFARWVLATLLRGTLGLPKEGMGQLSGTLARIPGARIHTNTVVTGLSPVAAGAGVELTTQRVDGTERAAATPADWAQVRRVGEPEKVTADRVIVAVDPESEAELLPAAAPSGQNARARLETMPVINSWWFVSDEPVSGAGYVTVDGTQQTPIARAAEVTAVAPGYAPGRHLLACNVVTKDPQAQLPSDAEIAAHLATLFGLNPEASRSWELVQRQPAVRRVPLVAPGGIPAEGEGPIVLAAGRYATPTVDGAVRSGIRAAQRVLKELEQQS